MMDIERLNKINLDLLQVGSQFVKQSVGKIKIVTFVGPLGMWIDFLKSY